MTERQEADALAERLLDVPNADPDDDLRVLSRQLLRRREVIERLEKDLAARCDDTLDMINANRDTILRIHEEGLKRIASIVLESVDKEAKAVNALGAANVMLILKVIEAVQTFHPMHGESWKGWPE